MKTLKIVGLFVFAILLNNAVKAQAVEEMILHDFCEFEDMEVEIKLSGMNSIGNDYYQVSFSSIDITLFNDTDIPGNDVVYESQNMDTAIFKFTASAAQQAGVTDNHAITVFIGVNQFNVDDDVTALVSPNVNITGSLPTLCDNDTPYDLNTHVDQTGGTFYLINVSYDPIESDMIVGNYLDPSVPEPSNSYGVVAYKYTGANGCSFIDEFSLTTPLVNEVPELSITGTTDATCGSNDGTANVVANGGSGNFNYYWSDGTTGDDLINASSGVYQAYVEDIDVGCTAELNVSIGNDAISTTVNLNKPTCWYDKGDIDLDVTSSTNYEVWWDFGVYGEQLTNIDPGVYHATITDDNGCEETVIVDLTADSPNPISVDDYNINKEDCNSGTIENGYIDLFAVSGGSDTLNYSWTGTGAGANSSFYEQLSSGDYTVTITDDLGCSITEDFHVGQWSFNSFYYVYTEEVTPATCDNDGSIEMFVTDDDLNPEITNYEWSNGATTTNLENVAAGDYTLLIEDTYGCSDQITVTVPAIKPMINPICLITVDSITTTNLIVWEREETSGISGYNIYREEGPGNYNLRGFTPSSAESVFNDVTASPKVKSWSYKIAAVNSCGVEGKKSIAHRTSHLKRTQNGNDFTLNWNLYEGFDYSTNGIKIYRYTDAQGQWALASTELPTATTYTETVTNNAGIDYAIEFEPDNGGCTATRAQSHNSSRSNRTEGVFNPGEGTGDTNNELEEFLNEDHLFVFPNPSNGVFNIEFDGDLGDMQLNYQVISIDGKVIAADSFTNNIQVLDLDDKTSGVYILRIYNKNGQLFKRLIKN